MWVSMGVVWSSGVRTHVYECGGRATSSVGCGVRGVVWGGREAAGWRKETRIQATRGLEAEGLNALRVFWGNA